MPLRHEEIRQLRELGWRVDGQAGNGHIRLVRERDGKLQHHSGTSSDWRAWRNLLARLRRLDAE